MLFFLKDNKKEFILWLNVPKVTAYTMPCCMLKSDLVKLIALSIMKVSSLKS